MIATKRTSYIYKKEKMIKSKLQNLLRTLKPRDYMLIFIYCIPILFYIVYFLNKPISKDPNDWANFGSYLGGIYTGFTPLFILYLTHVMNRKKDIEKRRILTLDNISRIFKEVKTDYQNINLINELTTTAINDRAFISMHLFNAVLKYTDKLKEIYGKKVSDYSLEKELNDAIIQEYQQYR